jgi:cytochrome c553
MKWMKILALAAVLSLGLHAQEDVKYLCIELKGEMGKELKALVEKYHGEIKEADVKTFSPREQQGRFANFDIEKTQGIDKTAMVERGGDIYQRRCQSCHGLNGEIKAYNKSRALNTLSAKEIEVSMQGYKNDTYDRGAAFVMKPHAISLNAGEVSDVAAYIEHITKNPIAQKEEE